MKREYERPAITKHAMLNQIAAAVSPGGGSDKP
jgi:hypothetical protein